VIGALSYFVGYDALKLTGYPEDGGFAINDGDTWSEVKFDNDEINCERDLAIAHGEYFFTSAKGGEPVRVEYSFVYRRMMDGKLKIILHHSSAPYKPPPEAALVQVRSLGAKPYYQKSPEPCYKDIEATQMAWKNAILSISDSYKQGGDDFVYVAEDAIHELYGYDIGPVLFKPTKAVKQPFRPTVIGALSYFVGYDNIKHDGFAEDTGFAINGGDGWTGVEFDNDEINCMGNFLFAQGYYYFTNENGRVGVEYSFGYQKMKNGKVKIILHHSSVPFSA